MPAPTRAQLLRLAAVAALSLPVAAGALLLSPSPARAAGSVFTIICPASDGSPGGATVSDHGQCGTYADTAPAAVTGSCQPLCLGGTTFAVTSASGSTLYAGSLDAVHSARTFTVPAGSPDGIYTATLSGGGADVSASLVLQTVSTTSTAPGPPVPTTAPGGLVPPTTSPTPGSSSAAPSTSASSPGSAVAPSSGAKPSTGSGHGAAVGRSGQPSVVRFPSLAPPAGFAALPPLPTFPVPSTQRAEGVPGPYGTTLPYDGSVTVAERTQPSLLRHVADTVDDKQFAASIAAAFLALLFAAHLRRFVRRTAGDADL
jgi:hypothetical protein